MSAVLTVYLHVDGEAVEAMARSAEVLGGELAVTTFGQAGQGDEFGMLLDRPRIVRMADIGGAATA